MPQPTGPDRLLFDQVTAALRKADHFEQTLNQTTSAGSTSCAPSAGAWDVNWAGKSVRSPQPSTAGGCAYSSWSSAPHP